MPNAGYFYVANGGTLTFQGTVLDFSVANTHYVDGTLDIQVPLAGTGKQTFVGDGTVKLASVSADAVEFADEITAECASLDSVSTAISVIGSPTIKATAEQTISANIEIEPHSTLTLDVGANAVTLGTVITGGGSLVKAGSGNLVLAYGNNVFDKLTVSGGKLLPAISDINDGYQLVLTVRELVGADIWPDGYKVKAVTNDDGTVSYYTAKIHPSQILFK